MKNWDYNASNAMEQWDIYDKNKNKLGYTKLRKSELNEDEYHLVVRIWIVNSKNEILLSRRGLNKRGGGLWECTGGSVLSGETSRQAVVREVKEEIGVDLNIDRGIIVMNERRDSHHDFYEIWLFREDIELKHFILDKNEVIGIKWVTIDEYCEMYEKEQIMPTLGFFPKIYEEFVVNPAIENRTEG